MPPLSQLGFEQRVVVGIADLVVTNNPNIVLTTYSLGSCLGVAIHDPVAGVGGLVDPMLPDSSIAPSKAASHPGMFVDSGVPALFRAAYTLHAEKRRLLIYLAGGAQIMDSQGVFNIGKRNYEAVRALLQEHMLTIQAEQVGGTVNRTLSLTLRTGQVVLKVSVTVKKRLYANG